MERIYFTDIENIQVYTRDRINVRQINEILFHNKENIKTVFVEDLTVVETLYKGRYGNDSVSQYISFTRLSEVMLHESKRYVLFIDGKVYGSCAGLKPVHNPTGRIDLSSGDDREIYYHDAINFDMAFV